MSLLNVTEELSIRKKYGLKCLLWLVTWWIKQKSPSFGWQLWWFVFSWVDASQTNNALKIQGFGAVFVTLCFCFRKAKKLRNWGKNAWPSMNQRSPKVCLWIMLTFLWIWTGWLEIAFGIDKLHWNEAEVVCFTWMVCELSLSYSKSLNFSMLFVLPITPLFIFDEEAKLFLCKKNSEILFE